MMDSSNSILYQSSRESLIGKLGIFRVQGRDKRGRKVLLNIGKLFPARLVSGKVLNKYLEEKVFTKLDPERPFSVVYVHTGVQRAENFPGISTLGSIYEAIPANVKNRLEAVYFLHPGLQARLFLATFCRFIFSGGLYGKLKYVNRVEFDNVRRNEIGLPEFAYDEDEEMECLRLWIMGRRLIARELVVAPLWRMRFLPTQCGASPRKKLFPVFTWGNRNVARLSFFFFPFLCLLVSRLF